MATMPRNEGTQPAVVPITRTTPMGRRPESFCHGDNEVVETDISQLPVRHAGRVIVLDPDDRVLLFRYEDPPPFGVHWATPGGGLERGEDFRAGAMRELREETGWDDVPVGEELPAVARWRVIFHAGGPTRQCERYFLARVPVARRPVADVDGMHAFDGIEDFRWWSLAELETTEDVVYPTGLADVLRGLASSLSLGNYYGTLWPASS